MAAEVSGTGQNLNQSQGSPKYNVCPGQEETLDIPYESVKQKSGFSIDIGGSMVKIVFASDEGATVRLHFVSHPRDEFERAIDYLEQKIGGMIPKGSVVNACGVGFQQHTQYIEERLGVSITVNNEMDCFPKGYRFLVKNIPFENLVYDASTATKDYVAEMVKMYIGVANHFDKYTADSNFEKWQELIIAESKKNNEQSVTKEEPSNQRLPDNPGICEQEENYPVLLVMLGSAAAASLLEKNGKYNVVEMSTRCGGMFLGLGKIVSGATSFNELIDLAERGNPEALNVMGKHLKTGHGDNIYSHMPDDAIMFSFGRAIKMDTDSIRKEDKAAALLNSICQDLAQTFHLTASVRKVKKMVICGSFPATSQAVRDEIGKALGLRCAVTQFVDSKVDFHFMKYGGYYGALGALITTLNEDMVKEDSP